MSNDLVTVAVARNEVVAALWRVLLEENGIPVLVKVLGLGHAYWSPFAAEHALLVRAQDAEKAATLLKLFDEEFRDESEPSL